PAGTPRDLVARISADAKTVLTLPEAKQRLAEQGAEPEPSAPDAFAAFVNSDIAKWLALAQKTGIRLTPWSRAWMASSERSIEDRAIDRRQGCEIGDGGALVDLMHGLPDQAELEHRAIVLDESGIRGAAGGRKLGLLAGHALDRARDEIDEW